MNDNEILALLESRDESALAELDKNLGRLIVSIARQITGSESDAEELKNDTLCKLWNSIPPAKPSSLKAYAAMLVRGLAINRVNSARAKKRGDVLPIDELAEMDGGERPESEVEARELGSIIDRFLAGCSVDERVMFIRRYVLVEPPESIARLMGISKNSLNVKLYRLRTRLKTYLKERGYFE